MWRPIVGSARQLRRHASLVSTSVRVTLCVGPDAGRADGSSSVGRFSQLAAVAAAATAFGLSAANGASGGAIACEEASVDSTKFDAARWADVLSSIKGGIVSLRINSVRAFDTHKAGAGVATGFVVDKELGLILTNRHVVTEGPVTAIALFDNHEEVPVRAVYRDPVHDFGFFRYDPSALAKPALVPELQLHPEKAAQGLDVRVIGNNAGEKLSVLGAMLARLDREAPSYGRGTYNDFNTFYFQAASATSGGSSGSPVVGPDGDVVALNAAGKTGTAASFYLPLDRAKRALELIRAGRPVPRGSLQATFSFVPFSELTRLGLTAGKADEARANGESIGMLAVKSVVPKGPSSGILEPGDVLISVAGVPATRFVPLEAALDDAVDNKIEVIVERGGELLTQHIHVVDLHHTMPREHLECGDAIFNDLSYHVARGYNVPVGGVGVYVAAQGYMLRKAGIPEGAVILQVGRTLTHTVRDLEAALAKLPDGAEVPIYFSSVANLAHRSVAMGRIDRTWFPMQRTVRDDPEPGRWTSHPSPLPPDAAPRSKLGSVRFAPGTNPVEEKVVRSLVKINASVPVGALDGMPGLEFLGTGILVDTERGLVVCDRNTVPGRLCDCSVTFGSSQPVPAHVVYIHPLHNLVVLAYDVGLAPEDGPKAATLSRASAHELVGKKLWHVTTVGKARTGFRLVSDQATAVEVEPRASSFTTPPRWEQTGIDLLGLRGGAPMSTSQDGVLCNDDGEVVAYWASFLTQFVRDGHFHDGAYFAGVPTDIVEDMLLALREGDAPVSRVLGVEMEKLSLAAVRGMLMDDATADTAESECKHWPPKVMSVKRRWADTPAHKSLLDNDVVLEVNGKRLETFRDIELAVGKEPIAKLKLVRDGAVMDVEVETMSHDHTSTDRVVIWCGAVLQSPPFAIAAQRGQEQRGVYVASRFHGSPCYMYGLPTMCRIVAVDGNDVGSIDDLLRVVESKKDGENVRVRHLDLRGAASVTCVRVDSCYWPTAELRRESGPRRPGGQEPYHWVRTALSGPSAS